MCEFRPSTARSSWKRPADPPWLFPYRWSRMITNGNSSTKSVLSSPVAPDALGRPPNRRLQLETCEVCSSSWRHLLPFRPPPIGSICRGHRPGCPSTSGRLRSPAISSACSRESAAPSSSIRLRGRRTIRSRARIPARRRARPGPAPRRRRSPTTCTRIRRSARCARTTSPGSRSSSAPWKAASLLPTTRAGW